MKGGLHGASVANGELPRLHTLDEIYNGRPQIRLRVLQLGPDLFDNCLLYMWTFFPAHENMKLNFRMSILAPDDVTSQREVRTCDPDFAGIREIPGQECQSSARTNSCNELFVTVVRQ